MQDNTVIVDAGADPPTLDFSPIFNVAVPLIDRHLGDGRGDKPAIRTVDETVTYGDLAARVNACGNFLRSLGMQTGERILMIVKDCPDFMYAFFGAVKAGVVPVPVNTMLRADDYRFMIEDSACTVLLYSEEFAETVHGALDRASHKPAHVLRTTGAGGLTVGMAGQPAELAPARTALMDDCFWLYSSGSTGNPKGVVHSHRDMVCTGQRVAV